MKQTILFLIAYGQGQFLGAESSPSWQLVREWRSQSHSCKEMISANSQWAWKGSLRWDCGPSRHLDFHNCKGLITGPTTPILGILTHRNREIISVYCCSKLLSFGEVCYTIIDNWKRWQNSISSFVVLTSFYLYFNYEFSKETLGWVKGVLSM